jgi:hypothetical protein
VSDRLTKKWTANTEAAFGESGRKGREGELYIIEVYTRNGYEVLDHEDSRKHQIAGIDISFRAANSDPFTTADVKHNLNNWNSFYVECANNGWLFKSQADKIIHCNVAKGITAEYKVSDMQDHVKAVANVELKLLKIEHMASPGFVDWKFNVK